MTMALIGPYIWIVGSQWCNYLERTRKYGLVGEGVLLRTGFEVFLNSLLNFTRLTFPFSRWRRWGPRESRNFLSRPWDLVETQVQLHDPCFSTHCPWHWLFSMVNFPALCWFTCPPITASSTCVHGWANWIGNPSAFFQGSTVRAGESVVRLANLAYK